MKRQVFTAVVVLCTIALLAGGCSDSPLQDNVEKPDGGESGPVIQLDANPQAVPPRAAPQAAAPSADQTAAREVAASFLEAWEQADFDAAKSLLTDKAAGNFARDTVFWFGAGASYELKKASVNGNEARVFFDQVSLISSSNRAPATVVLRKEKDAWRVADVALGGGEGPGRGFSMPMRFESEPFRMPYANKSPEGEIEWQPTESFPPADSRRTDPAAWTTDLAELTFPDSPVAGQLWGNAFEAEEVVLRECGLGAWELTLHEYLPDRSLILLLYLDETQIPSEETCQMAGRREIGGGRTMVNLFPEMGTKIFHNVILNLQFDQASGDTLPGRIYLCLPDTDKSFVAGEFVAGIERLDADESETPAGPTNELAGTLPSTSERQSGEPIPDVSPTDTEAVRRVLLSQQSDEGSFTTKSIEAITRHGSAVVPTLAKLLEDRNDFVRKQAAHLLGDIGPDAAEAVPALIDTLDDSESFVRGQAAEALGQIGPAARSAGPALMELIEHGDMWSLEEALNALEKTGADTEGLGPVLIRVIKANEAFTLQKAAAGLKQFALDTKPAVPLLIERLQVGHSYQNPEAAAALGEIGPEAKAAGPALLKVLQTIELNEKPVVAEALRRIEYDASAAVPALIEAVETSEEGFDRRHAIEALGKLGAPAAPAVPLLIEMAKSGDFIVEDAAIEALGNIGPAAEPAIDPLVEMAKTEDFPGKPIGALGKIGPPAIPALTELLKEEWQISQEAALALGQMGPAAEPAVPALVELAQSGKSFANGNAVKALGQIGPPAIPALVELLQSSESINVKAAEALGQMGAAAEPALPELEQARQQASAGLKKAIDEAVKAIEADLEKQAAQTSNAGNETQTPPASAVRKWTSSDGSHTIEAELVEVQGGDVVLKRADNSQNVTVPIDKLSEADQQYLAEQQ